MSTLGGLPRAPRSPVIEKDERVILVSNVITSSYIAKTLKKQGVLEAYVSPLILTSQGAGRFARHNLVSRRFRPDLAGIPTHQMWWYELLRRIFHALPLGKYRMEITLAKLVYRRYRRLLRKGTMLYIHSAVSTPLVLEASRLGLKVVVDHRSRYPSEIEPSVVEAEVIEEFKAATHIVVNSQLVLQEFLARSYDPDMLRVVELAADTATFNFSATTTENSRTVLFVGNLSLRKGVDLLVGASEALNEKGIEVLLVGHSSKDYDVPSTLPNVRVLGPRSPTELARLYRSCALFVLPSRSDAFGLVAVEAAASGCPVLISENVGAKDFLTRYCSIVVMPLEDRHSIAQAITDLIQEPGRLAAMRRSELEAHASFGWERYEARLSNAMLGTSSPEART